MCPMLRRLARHRPSSLVAYTVAGAAVVLATFLPWLHSGTTSRTSYDLLGVLARLDIAPHGIVSHLVTWWPVVPLLVTMAVVMAWWRWWVPSMVTAAVAVVYAGGVGTTLVVATRGTGIGVGAGPLLCAAASGVFLVTSVWMVFTHASERAARARTAAPPGDPS